MFSSYSQQLFCYFSLCAVLILFLQWPASSWAQGDLEGSFRLRSNVSQSQNDSLIPFLTQWRIHLKGEYHPSNDFKAQMHILSANPYDGALSLDKIFNIYPSARWMIGKNFEFRLGRNLYNSQFHQIVSLNDYEPFFYAFDGLFLEYTAPAINVKFWGARPPEQWTGLQQSQSLKYGFGFFLDIKSVLNYIESLNLHAAYLADSFFSAESRKISRYGMGLNGAVDLASLDYVFVAVGHGRGVQFKLEESMYHALLSYSRPDFFKSKIFFGYHTDSSKYDPWLYDRHKSAGLLDIFLWGNLTYYFLGLSGSAADWFDIRMVFYDLRSTDKGFVRMGYLGSLLNAKNESHARAGPQSLGRELDIQIQKQISKEFEIHLLAGLFAPHIYSKDLFKKKDFFSNIQLTGLYKF